MNEEMIKVRNSELMNESKEERRKIKERKKNE